MSFPCVLQVSLQSRRLPKKALLNVEGKPLVERVVEGILPSPAVRKLIIQIPAQEEERELFFFLDSRRKEWAEESGKPVNILQFGVKASWADFSFMRGERDPFFRVTGDCPLLDPSHFSLLTGSLLRQVSFTHHDSWDEECSLPDGWDIELFNGAALPLFEWNISQLYRNGSHPLPVLCYIPRPAGLATSVNRWQDLEMIRRIYREVADPHSYPQVVEWWSHTGGKEGDI